MKPIKVTWRSSSGTLRPLLLTADAEGIRLNERKKVISAIPWPDVDRFSFEDPKRTKVNVGAVLAFGVLGLGARKNFTFIYFAAGTQTGVLEVDGLPAQWRGWIDQLLIEVPEAHGKVFIGDYSPAPAPMVEDGIPAQIKQLADLRDQGILTDTEFEAKKQDLLSRM